MEEKNNKNHVLYLIIIVLLIIIIAMLWYQLSQVNNSNTESIGQLQNNLSAKDSQIATLENTLDNLTNTAENTTSSTTTNNTSNTSKTNSTNYTEITNALNGIDVLYVTNAIENSDSTYTLQGVIYTQYTLSKDELNSIQKAGSMKLDGNTYTVKPNGNEYDVSDSTDYVLYKIKSKNSNEYYLERQAQLSDVWKLSNEFREITVASNLTCTGLGYESDTTIAKYFKNYTSSTPVETTTPDATKTFSFTFQNGKCTKVVNELTSLE